MRSGLLRSLTAGAVLISALLAAPVLASEFGAGASGWHVGYFTPSPRGTLSFSDAAPAPGGDATFAFTNQPNTALLVTYQPSQFGALLGDDTGKTINAKFTVSGATGAFTYFGEGTPSNPCPGPANVRLYFQTSNAGGFDPTHFWWSNPMSMTLTNGTFSLMAKVERAEWSDFNGHFGTMEPAAFAAAAADVTRIGLSFGGGCFFENGVGTTDGSGTFTLTSYTLS